MREVWLQVAQMSVDASWMVLAVALVRRVVDRAPKWIWVLLWGLVGVRLMCPLSLESAWSVVPRSVPVLEPLILSAASNATGGAPVAGQGETAAVSPAAPMPSWDWTSVLAGMWLVGVAVMLAYGLVGAAKMRRRVTTAIPMKKNLYQCEQVTFPFVLGLVRPRIYLPFGLSGEEERCVVAHERAHIQRGDHWWKPLGFLVLAVHWFNPLVWLAYVLFCRDLELACDEKVIRSMDREERANYSQALLTYSVGKKRGVAAPLAFGEVGVQRRIREVLFHQRPTIWAIAGAVCLCAVVVVCFLPNPVEATQEGSTVEAVPPEQAAPQQQALQEQQEPDAWENWLDRYATTEEHTGSLAEDKTDDPKVNLFNQMLNTMDSYNRLDLTMKTSMLSQTITTVEYHIDIDGGTSYQATWEDGALMTEEYNQGISKVLINIPAKTYDVELGVLYSRKNAYYIPLDQRITIEEDGVPCYRYRRDPSNCSLSSYCVDPQELTYSYLADMDLWDIVDDDVEYLGRPCVRLRGTTSDYIAQKHSADHFTMLVDKATGILMDFQTTQDGQMTRYMTVTAFELEGTGPIETFDLADYSGFSSLYQ